MMNPPVKWLEATILGISAFNLFLVFVKILLTKSRLPIVRTLLLVWFFVMGVAMIMLFLMDTQLILRLPWLYRLPSPGYFLVFPCAYLFIRMILTKNNRLTRWDALHGLPAVLHFVELLPFYLKPNAYKLEVLKAVLSKPLGSFAQSEGVLVEHHNIILIGIIGLGYSIGMIRLMHVTGTQEDSASAELRKTRTMLWIFVFLQLIFALSPIALLGFPQIGVENVRSTLLYTILALTQLSAASIFILYPNIQNGVQDLVEKGDLQALNINLTTSTKLPQKATKNFERNQSEPAKIGFNGTEQQLLLVKKLEAHLDEKKSFLNKNINVSDLATALQVPTHHLSQVLNQVIGQRFSDYINQKRIEYIEQRILIVGLKKYTFETIALEAGFNSRVTFIRALRKLKGSSPKVYFKNFERQHRIKN